MCSRYVLNKNYKDLESQFGIVSKSPFEANYNAAPTSKMPVVFAEDGNVVTDVLTWGYNTGWTSGPKFIINLKSETVLEKKFAVAAASKSRCVLPATSFIEWLTHEDGSKQPVLFEAGDLFGLGGLIFTNKKKEKEFIVLTTTPNGLVGKVHDRMPVVLARDSWEKWLVEPGAKEAFDTFAKPFPEAGMEAWMVDPAISSSRSRVQAVKIGKLS